METITRRSVLALAGSAPMLLRAQGRKHVPIGIELYAVRDELTKDLTGTVRAVAKMGYEVVEFYSPYFGWTTDYAKEIRKLLDDLGIRCPSTHNGANSFTAEGLPKAIELNQIIGSRYVIMASPGRVTGLDSYKAVAERLSEATEKMRPLGMAAGYHNHQAEFRPIDGKMPMEVLAEGTPKDTVLQLDVGTCVEVGVDPVAWINANPGRIKSIHCKDWAPGDAKEEKGYRVLVGEGAAPWAKIIEAAETRGGVEAYLIEQEGSRYSSLETAERCLANWKKLRG